MSGQMQYIDDFFTGQLSSEEVKAFEQRINTDPEFAADVAFYVSSKHAAKEIQDDEKKERFRTLYAFNNGHQHAHTSGKLVTLRSLIRVAVAAAVITAIIVTINLNNGSSINEVADKYIQKEYTQLPVSMGATDDLAKAAQSYNEGKYAAAEAAFEDVMAKDTNSYYAVQYAGIAAMRAGNYAKALQHFRTLEKFRTHYNPAVLLQAVALLKRNQPGDKRESKLLLQRVIANNLDGKETARELLSQ